MLAWIGHRRSQLSSLEGRGFPEATVAVAHGWIEGSDLFTMVMQNDVWVVLTFTEILAGISRPSR